ncbi:MULTISPECIES: hypothetical protein [Pseudomonas syringae group]|uniref:hypothetical protein n=1 Tax=Pseudomonas syringae group TaxID=136849 RepID=UPI000F0029B5|nr:MULTISPECIES: hypothetical protein [Pseudomonas syringae group]MCK0547877.1 hypothetical protein [Pseudomonas syringae pv. aptata]
MMAGMEPDQREREMQQHPQKVFFEFFSKHPFAERRDYGHQDGKTSVVAVSLTGGEPDEALIALYDSDGKMLLEDHLSNDKLKAFVNNSDLAHTEVLARLTERVQREAGTIIVKN